MSNLDTRIVRLHTHGFVLLANAVDPATIADLCARLTDALAAPAASSGALESRGVGYASRDPLAAIPDPTIVWRRTTIEPFLLAVLGPEFGLVRGLLFDKPPGRNWSLPWHRDETIAVAEHRSDAMRFTRPTRKNGVPHMVAPRDVLESMLTLRVHLDDVDDENGPLQVLPGSHGEADDAAPVAIHAKAGDVLAMRPLLSHASAPARSDTPRRRRILHLEFAATPTLPEGFVFHRFVPGVELRA